MISSALNLALLLRNSKFEAFPSVFNKKKIKKKTYNMLSASRITDAFYNYLTIKNMERKR